MIRIQVGTPFRLQFRSKDIWLTAHEDYYLDINKSEEREELKYLLSNLFPYRDFIYIDEDQVGLALLKEVSDENGFTPVGEQYEEVIEHPTSLPEDSFIVPPQDPPINTFVDRVEISIPDKIEATDLERALPADEPVEEVKLEEVADEKIEAIAKRAKELSALSVRKIKDLAQEYGIDYTNKEETIESILIMEF
jgi:hypothetical protein